ENIIEHALIVCQEKIIERNHLPLALQTGISPQIPAEATQSINQQIETSEKTLIIDMLRKYGWNKGKTALALNVNRSTLWRKMKKYNISL
ncbi:MAG: hypothetical protein KJO34_02350, partial [Deltaproteobacteria bacterium]|nr:hypothetical protein [Deltaproteobacteria bacterium]